MTPHHVALRFALPVAAVMAFACPASAGNSADEAAAEILFTDGKKLADAGNFAAACPKFEESQRLDAGAGTLLNLGACYESLGKLASAFGAFKEAEVTARNAHDAVRQAEATRRAEALSLKLARLVIVVPLAARVPGFEVKRNGATVGEGQWGSGVPVDPGDNTITATAPGYKPWSKVVHVDAHPGSAQIEIPPLEKGAGESGAVALGGSTQRTLGFAAVGVGGAALIAGAITLGLNAVKNANLAKQCPMGRCTGLQPEIDAYHTLGIVSSTSLVVGSALAATGVILVLVTPSTQRSSISPLVGPGYAGLSGRF